MARPRYRFGFVVTTLAGNQTRYRNLRKFAERDPSVECVWAPNPGFLDPDPFRFLPNLVRGRLVTLTLAAPVLGQLASLDAVFFAAFEPYVLTAIRSLVTERPLLVWSKDDPPTDDPEFWFHYGVTVRSARRARLRFLVDKMCARRTSLFFPFSRWAGDALVANCRVPAERVHPGHGIDLDHWPYVPRRDAGGLPKILFVGGDFLRKGGDLLLEVFRERFSGRAELHLVSREAPDIVPKGVVVHRRFAPNDPGLKNLYDEATLLVLPTRLDLSPNVVLEAMASGVPVVATAVAGIPEMVRDGETGFLVAVNDPGALGDRIDRLLRDAPLRAEMSRKGRILVEREFSAETVVARMLERMKAAVDDAGGRPGVSRPEASAMG